ncbi:MAG: hypothetical protein ACK2T0_01585, partial [Anaerolineales bacterium]
VGLGMVVEIWLANALAHALPVVTAFGLAGLLVAGMGGLAAVRFRSRLAASYSVENWILLLALTVLFAAIGRGLGIFDDYQNLPTVSLMAAGDVPPHFALNPALRFGYHYALLLFAAEIMRLASMFPWSALDLARGFSLALPLVLAGLWGYRLTRSRLAGMLTAFVVALSGGSRWLLLLLPASLMERLSANVHLIGSAAQSAPSLAQAMITTWKIDGGGPIPFPFAFYSGVNQPYVMAYTGIGGSGILIVLLVLLTAGRWRHWSAAFVELLLLASLAFANEIAFLLVGLGMVIVSSWWVVSHRSVRLPRSLALWLTVLAGALAVGILQGGLLTEMARGLLTRDARTAGYFDTSPVVAWPPAIVSAHFGALSVFDLRQLAVGLLEIGPIVLATPLVLAWGKRSLRARRWLEAAVIYALFGAAIGLFVQFTGPLFTATPRLMSGWFFACALYAVPVGWIWLRTHSESWRAGALCVGLIACLGGLVLLAVQLAAIQRPMFATFITPMDAKMAQEYWDKLDAKGEIFDPVVYRAPTVFGRFTDSSPTWYTRLPAWEALREAPSPNALTAAGFEYVYFGSDYWEGLTSAQRSAFDVPCVKQVAQVDGIHSESDYTKDFRRLLDIGTCPD